MGKRVRIYWANERDCFKGTVSGFDPETWLHSLEYDDGDVEPAIRLWREVCHLGVPEDTRADEENTVRGAKRRKVAETEIAEAKKQLEAAEAERDRLELSREMADDDEADDLRARLAAGTRDSWRQAVGHADVRRLCAHALSPAGSAAALRASRPSQPSTRMPPQRPQGRSSARRRRFPPALLTDRIASGSV